MIDLLIRLGARVPLWVFRPLCWIEGHAPGATHCTVCAKRLTKGTRRRPVPLEPPAEPSPLSDGHAWHVAQPPGPWALYTCGRCGEEHRPDPVELADTPRWLASSCPARFNRQPHVVSVRVSEGFHSC